MNIYTVADVLTRLFEAIMMTMLLDTFLKRRETFGTWVYGISVLIMAVMIHISNIVFSYGIMNAVGMGLAIFLVSLFYDGKAATKAVITILGLVLIGIMEIMVLFLVTTVYGITVSQAVDVASYRLLGIIISKMLTFGVINILRIKFKEKKLNITTSYWLFFIIIFANSVVAVFLIFKLSYDTASTYMYNLSVLCSFGLLFCTFFALYLYEHLAKQSQIIAKQQQFEQQIKDQSKHLDEMLISQNKLRKFRHDFLNHLTAINGYFSSQDYTGGLDYIKQIDKLSYGLNDMIETGNVALDAIVNSKKALAESKGISFDINIQIPERLALDATDICIIFGNALDNAIEACERIEIGDKRISFTVIYDNNSVICKIANTALKGRKLVLSTVKRDKRNHGFGIVNIKTALERYNHTFKVNQTETEFALSFIIYFS